MKRISVSESDTIIFDSSSLSAAMKAVTEPKIKGEISEEIRHIVQSNKNAMKMAWVGVRHFAFSSAEWRADQGSELFA